MKGRAPDHIVNDLGRKAAEDVKGAIARPASLLWHPNDRGLIAIVAAAQALGATIGFAEQPEGWGSGLEPEKLVDGLWEHKLRPLILGIVRGEAPEAIVRHMQRMGDL